MTSFPPMALGCSWAPSRSARCPSQRWGGTARWSPEGTSKSRGGGAGGRGLWPLWLLTWRCTCSDEITGQRLPWGLHFGQLIPDFLVLAMLPLKHENQTKVMLLATELGLRLAWGFVVQIGGEWIGQRWEEEWEAQISGSFVGDIFSLLERNCVTVIFQWICLAAPQGCSGFREWNLTNQRNSQHFHHNSTTRGPSKFRNINLLMSVLVVHANDLSIVAALTVAACGLPENVLSYYVYY